MAARAIKANALFERYWVSQDESDRASGRALVDSLQDSRDAAAYTARGNRALVDGDTLGAVNALQQAVAADPTDAYAQHQLGFSLNAAGRPEEALAHFKRALELVPDIAWAQSNLLVTLVELERCDENIPGLQPAVAASCNNHLGVLRDNAQRFRDARGHFERAVQAAPDSALFHANLAGTLVKLGDRGDATLHARQARTLGLSDHWVFGALGE
jgi:tetratricopeptide (TPR) repeat protein